MEGDTGRHSTLGTDSSPHKNELQLVNIDTSGEQASSPTCPLNLLVPSKVDLELSDPFLSGGGGGGGGDRTAPSSGYTVPTDQLVDFKEKGSREADGSDRGDDCDLQLIGEDALGMSGEADMDNIFQEALALADQFSELDKQDEADVSLVDSAPQSLPGESELLSLDAALLAALAESRRELPPYRPRGLTDTPLDSSFPVPSAAPAAPGPFTVSSLRSASAAAVAQAASAAASLLPPPPPSSASSSLPGSAPGSVPGSALGSASDAPAPATSSADGPHSAPGRPSVSEAAPAAASPVRPSPAAAASSRLPGRQRASPAISPPASPPPATDRPREASPPSPPPPTADDHSAYADLCQQASAEQRELELQADEEYENRQFEQMERQLSREEVDARPPGGDRSQPHPRSQLSRKETYICRPNTGTFKVDKKQRFGTYKVDKTGTFKVPRPAASAARSLPPELEPEPGGLNGRPEPEPVPEPEERRAATPGNSVNGMPSADSMNTYCQYGDDEFGERSPSPPRAPLSASTPEREDPGRPDPRRPAGLRRPFTSTPCRSAGSSGSSIGVTPIRAPPAGGLPSAEDSPAPAAALRAAALRQVAGSGLRQPAASAPAGLRKPAAAGLRQPAASGLRQPAASGLRQPAASGLRQPATSGLKQPTASGLKQPTASGLRQPAASGLRPPSASGLRAPSAAAAPRSAPARRTAAQLRRSSAQSGSDSSVCSVRSLPGPNTSRSNPSLVADRSDSEAPSLRQPRQLPGPSSRLPARGGVRRSAGGTGSLTNISLQASHTTASGLRRPTTARNRTQETSKLSLSQQPAGSERF